MWMLSSGNKPDYRLAMGPGDAEPMYDEFVRRCRAEYGNAKGDTAVQTGIFGAHIPRSESEPEVLGNRATF
ncbi:D-tyrosyl-tRNA(Tyr) deacylase [Perkinsus olseni]|uniref:D-tyrosyl-tRNA(Tyr) deacylase n=1 Tax=Perkinsus olseni TaxID=32597 RepID=A0A7J6PG02_PEROL|nr:D-tyrosyl-tRNA(Tyr) deacylase [Perkinsus olseni]